MIEWVWSNGGMILTGETEVLGEKHYTAWVVDGDEYGAMVELYWQDISEKLGGKRVQVPHHPPPTLYGLTWDETRAFAEHWWKYVGIS